MSTRKKRGRNCDGEIIGGGSSGGVVMRKKRPKKVTSKGSSTVNNKNNNFSSFGKKVVGEYSHSSFVRQIQSSDYQRCITYQMVFKELYIRARAKILNGSSRRNNLAAATTAATAGGGGEVRGDGDLPEKPAALMGDLIFNENDDGDDGGKITKLWKWYKDRITYKATDTKCHDYKKYFKILHYHTEKRIEKIRNKQVKCSSCIKVFDETTKGRPCFNDTNDESCCNNKLKKRTKKKKTKEGADISVVNTIKMYCMDCLVKCKGHTGCYNETRGTPCSNRNYYCRDCSNLEDVSCGTCLDGPYCNECCDYCTNCSRLSCGDDDCKLLTGDIGDDPICDYCFGNGYDLREDEELRDDDDDCISI